MGRIPEDYIERVYAGWLGKIIGIRHGANTEGWTSESIEKVYGEITDYLFDFKNFAADDDSNGPIFFLRALEDYTWSSEITAEQIGLTWLNYVPYEHGFLCWGGYGVLTEHTAYLNLRNGIMPPRSGSSRQNGVKVAEQIGGQIFIDTWGLVAPANPELAAEYAQKAASVSHGGNGKYGGMFIAACISAAFIERSIEKIIEAGLSVIPAESEYAKVVRAVINFYHRHSQNWKDCLKFIKSNYWTDRYPGLCHIVPNAGIIILALLYGKGDFSNSLNICNMCGFDTDCNLANLGTIVGVRNGLKGIDYNKWRKPINDFLACSSVIGSLNIMDIPWCAAYIANLAYKIANEEPPEKWSDILSGKAARFNFEFPGSTHSFRVSSDLGDNFDYTIGYTGEYAHSGKGSLKVTAKLPSGGNELRIFHKTYYRPNDFNDSRYDPSFSPILYPGQTVKGFVLVLKDTGFDVSACLYVKDGNSGNHIESEKVILTPGEWKELIFKIPHLAGAFIEEAGIKLIPMSGSTDIDNESNCTLVVFLDDFDFYGNPDYTIDFAKERTEAWNELHEEVSQFSYLKGIWLLEDGQLSGSCYDFGEAYTGAYDWKDYCFEATMIPKIGLYHNINFRVQGAIRSYALGLAPENKLVLYKNENGYKALAEISFPWEHNKEYRFKIKLDGAKIKVSSYNNNLIEYTDKNAPYTRGQIGVSIQKGSHCHYKDFKISPLKYLNGELRWQIIPGL